MGVKIFLNAQASFALAGDNVLTLAANKSNYIIGNLFGDWDWLGLLLF